MPDPEALNEALRIAKALSGEDIAEARERDKPLNKYVLTPLGKVLDVLDTDLNATTAALRPILTGLNPELEAVYQKKGFNTIPSDLVDASMEDGPAKFALGFASDVLLSPSTYVGIGLLTKAGKTVKAASSLSKAGNKILKGSKLAANIEETIGVGKEAVKVAKQGLAPSLAAQAEAGQRALISVGIPFVSEQVPLIRGQAMLAHVDSASKALKESNVGKAFRKLFSNATGNPAFDKLLSRFQSLARYRVGLREAEGLEFGKELELLAKDLDIPKEKLRVIVDDLAENKYNGNLTAEAMQAAHTARLEAATSVPRETFESTLKRLPGYDILPMAERGKIARNLYRQANLKQRGVNVYTVGLRVLPEQLRTEFANLFTREVGMKHLVGLPIRGEGRARFSDFGRMLQNYSKGVKVGKEFLQGDDALVYSLTGAREFKRIKGVQQAFDKMKGSPQWNLLPEAIKVGTGTEYAQMANVGHQIIAHIDEAFGRAHVLYQTNPKYLQKINPHAHSLITKMYADPTWKVNALMEQFHMPRKYAQKYPGAFDLAQKFRLLQQEQLQRELGSGLPTTEFIGDIDYIAHIPAKAVRDILEQTRGFRGAGREWSAEHANQLVRGLRNIKMEKVNEAFNLGQLTKGQATRIQKGGINSLDKLVEEGVLSAAQANDLTHFLSVSEVNAMARKGDLRILRGQKVDRFFDENPANIIRIRGARGERARTAKEFFDAVRQFGKPVGKGEFPEKGFTMAKAEPLRGLAFEDDVARHIDKYYEKLILPGEANKFLEVYDGIQDEWKAWTLAIWPAYHLRNAIGNMWNNFLAGMGPAESVFYKEAGKIQRGGTFHLQTIAGEVLNQKQILNLADEYGLLNSGQFWGDIEKYFEDDVKGALGRFRQATKGVRNQVIHKGLKAGSWIENNAKLAHFMWRLREGDSAIDAARSVQKYLFDYRDLTDVEKQIFRRVAPFYTWTRKNVPLQLEALITQPAKAGGVLKFKNAYETNHDGDPDERMLPDWVANNFAVRARKNPVTGNHEYFMLGGWIPLADIDRIFDPVRFAGNMLSPLLKEPIQQVANRDFFTGREIDQGDEYQRLLGINMGKRTAHFLKNVRAINEADRLVRDDDAVEVKIGGLLTGKAFTFNEEESRKFKKYELNRKEAQYEQQLRRARRKEDEAEIARVFKLLAKLKEQRSDLGVGK